MEDKTSSGDVMSRHFLDISAGRIQKPNKSYMIDKEFYGQNKDVARYCDTYVKNMGAFWTHFCSSIPYILEEQCRIGLAICSVARNNFSKNKPLLFYETSAAEGAAARTIADFADGYVHTLTDGLHKPNEVTFHALSNKNFSKYFSGHYYEVNYDIFSRAEYLEFRSGFDFIYENCTFQFYGSDRASQIAHIRPLVKNDGVAVFLEKLSNKNTQDYDIQEVLKNKFKSQYFCDSDITWKSKNILDRIATWQVTIEELLDVIHLHFNCAEVLWRSGNFYELIASDSPSAILRFKKSLAIPCRPRISGLAFLNNPQHE